MDINTQLPVLVYGTLRPTGGNYEYFLDGFTDKEQTVRIPGFTMYGNVGCPFLSQEGDGEVTFTMVDIDPDLYEEVMKGLDGLEGFRAPGSPMNSYERILYTFTLEGETVQAWVYVASESLLEVIKDTTPVVPGGDWLTHVKAQSNDEGEWVLNENNEFIWV